MYLGMEFSLNFHGTISGSAEISLSVIFVLLGSPSLTESKPNIKANVCIPVGPDEKLWWETRELVAMEIQMFQDACPVYSLREAGQTIVGCLQQLQLRH